MNTLALNLLLLLSQGMTQEPAPAWLHVLPERPGRVYALGTAAIAPNEARALESAAQNARFEVLARLRATIRGSTTVTSSMALQQQSGVGATGSRQEAVLAQNQTLVQASELPGLVIEARFIDRAAHAAYALAYLDVARATEDLRQRLAPTERAAASLPIAPPGCAFRPRLARLQALHRLRGVAEGLDSQAALLQAGGLPPELRQEVARVLQTLKEEESASRAQFSMGLRGGSEGLGPDLVALLRNVVIQQGFSWWDEGPEAWLEASLDRQTRAASAGLIVARCALRISLVEPNGPAQESFDLTCKGVGADAFAAERALQRELARQLPSAFQQFLARLTP